MLNYNQYVKDAVRTEADYVAYRDAFTDDGVRRFYQFLRETVKFSQHADVWKKHLMYRKGPLPEKLPSQFHVLTPAAIVELREDYTRLSFARLFHGAIGLITEAGEILEAIQKSEIDKVNIAEESGDLKWYGALIDDVLQDNAFDPEGIFRTNILKLRKRYPQKFTEDSAQNRDLAAERVVLEGVVDAAHSSLFNLGPATRRAGDKVEAPAHYGGADNPYEAIKVITAWKLGFKLGTVLKYICRAGKKPNEPELDDLKKARFYLDARIAELENRG